MPWLKMLHVVAIICWCGLLLYLPALIARSSGGGAASDSATPAWHMSHWLFALVATPAALIAIGSGTAIIFMERPLAIWLVLKLAAVTAMVGCHALAGLLIVRLEHRPDERVAHHCAALSLVSLCLILAVAWLVLRKTP